MKFFSFLPALAVVVAISGCASDTPLPFNQLGDFSAYPLNKQTFRISYTANDNISYAAAQNITLIKAAQTTIQNGYQYFIVMNSSSNVHKKPQREVTYAGGGYGGGYWGGGPGFWGPGAWGPGAWGPPVWNDPFYGVPQVVTTGPAEIAYNIECFANEQTAPQNAYNATLILTTIGQKYGVSPTGQVIIQQPEQHK
ncbi:unnamed protein product [Commensalibacter communis]|uniref:DUF4136 domain-containing protein n=1 Tax=Commensalibacter communis TaxID=2972786 RepID=A0A9W4TMM7_9PROT|nr:hypothetical protein [Commensalibacter communis]CAI3933173.1 unnamed protein product [Commensalibacter communis]CAI3942916.1 unnamed protein product [Commensalibacter communis]CAI3945280.1 unnamed protein product [Commensalibacter communis]CAI3945466.1 unnamed protein product [Commensalibacter communis]CAI3951643.1 unnamed protein product [Commensalibacter communis]